MSIPSDWKICHLGDVASFHDEQRVPIKAEDRAKRRGDFPYFGASGQIDTIDDFIFDGDFVLLAEDGANILDRSSPIAFQAKGKFWVNNHAHILKANSATCNEFLVYTLEAMRYEKYNTGSAQPKLNREVCETIRLALPPIDEQQAIVEILSDCDATVKQTEQQLIAMKQRFKSFCDEAWRLGEESNSLGQIGDFFSGLTGKSAADFGQGERFVTYMGVFDGPYVKETGFGLVSVGALERQSRLIAGDLLITMTSESKAEAGLTAIFDNQDANENVYLNSFCAGFRRKKDIRHSPELLHALMNSRQFRAAVWRISQGSTRINLSRVELSKLKLSLPALDKSLLLGESVREFAKQEEEANKALLQHKKFKRGLMQQLLTGKLRVKGAA